MKKFLSALLLGLFFLLSSCSVLDTVANKVVSDSMSQSSSGDTTDSSSASGSGSSEKSSSRGKGQFAGMPPQMVPMMFPALYAAYFYWGGVYYADSLKPGEWAKYEFVNHEEGQKEAKSYLTKAYLRKEGKNGGWYYFKIGDDQGWMAFTFKVEDDQKVTQMSMKNSDGQTQEITITDPIMVQPPAGSQSALNFKNLPKETVQVPAGKLSSYKWMVASRNQDGESARLAIYLSPSVPGYLVKYEVENKTQDSKGIGWMALTAYGKNAAKELKD